MTKQDVFNRVYTHFVYNGGKPSWDGACRYRCENGAKCAIGIFIPEDEYDGYIEGQCLLGAVKSLPTIAALIGSVGTYFLQMLQSAHDTAAGPYQNSDRFVDRLRSRLKELANAEQLIIPEPPQYVTLTDAARLLGLTAAALRYHEGTGTLAVYTGKLFRGEKRVGNSIKFITVTDLISFVTNYQGHTSIDAFKDCLQPYLKSDCYFKGA